MAARRSPRLPTPCSEDLPSCPTWDRCQTEGREARRFLRQHHRTTDGKRHTYYSLVESVRTERGPRQRVIAERGDLTEDQQRRWQRTAIFHTRHAIASRFGPARRGWVLDRGIATAANLDLLRQKNQSFLVGTPRSQPDAFEAELCTQDWQQIRASVEVRGVQRDGQAYVSGIRTATVRERNPNRDGPRNAPSVGGSCGAGLGTRDSGLGPRDSGPEGLDRSRLGRSAEARRPGAGADRATSGAVARRLSVRGSPSRARCGWTNGSGDGPL